MNREEAINVIKGARKYLTVGNPIWNVKKVDEAMNMAIEALSADTSSDLISRADAILWVKTECNPYGKPTLEFESGKRVIEHLKQMPSADPKTNWIPCSERLPSEDGFYIATCDGEICGEDQPFTGFAEFENRKWVDDEDDYQCVLAWMPLPKPYREGGEQE